MSRKTKLVNTKGSQRPKSNSRLEKLIRDSLAKELLAVCFASLRRQGVSAVDLRRIAGTSIRSDVRVSPSRVLMQDISRLGRLISEWTENPRYVDGTGRPKVLAIAGDNASFEELARKHFPARTAEGVVRFAMKFKALERVDQNSVAHLGTCVLLTGNRTLLLSHAVRAVRWFLATSEYNGKKVQKAPWPERQAVTELPEEKFSDFLQFMREPIVNLVDMGNRWLMANASAQDGRNSGGPDRKSTLVGVHAYVFRDRPVRKARARSRA